MVQVGGDNCIAGSVNQRMIFPHKVTFATDKFYLPLKVYKHIIVDPHPSKHGLIIHVYSSA